MSGSCTSETDGEMEFNIRLRRERRPVRARLADTLVNNQMEFFETWGNPLMATDVPRVYPRPETCPFLHPFYDSKSDEEPASDEAIYDYEGYDAEEETWWENARELRDQLDNWLDDQ
jgi:hypothetical protein